MATINNAIILNIFEIVYSFEEEPEYDDEAKDVGDSK